jgi:hypothetical protein
MSKGEEKDKRKSIAEEESIAINDKGGDCWKYFSRQHRLVIDGKYSSNVGLSTTVKQTSESFKDSRKISSGGITFL